MKNDGIACQVHIPDGDHQGDGLTANQKIKVVELSIEHLIYIDFIIFLLINVK